MMELGAAKRRFNLRILNYIATSNHIHLLIYDPNGDAIPPAMQWVAGRTAQEYNVRRGREGAFWSDRYHATAIDSDEYLWRCMLYINLNMVRAGVVKHPKDWYPSGYAELLSPKKRYGLLAFSDLLMLLKIDTLAQLQQLMSQQTSEVLQSNQIHRTSFWTEAVAVGNQVFLENISNQLGNRIKGRDILQSGDTKYIRERDSPLYIKTIAEILMGENTREWQVEAPPGLA
jgi:putative transposase